MIVKKAGDKLNEWTHTLENKARPEILDLILKQKNTGKMGGAFFDSRLTWVSDQGIKFFVCDWDRKKQKTLFVSQAKDNTRQSTWE